MSERLTDKQVEVMRSAAQAMLAAITQRNGDWESASEKFRVAVTPLRFLDLLRELEAVRRERNEAELQLSRLRDLGLALVPHVRTMAMKLRVHVPGLPLFERALADVNKLFHKEV